MCRVSLSARLYSAINSMTTTPSATTRSYIIVTASPNRHLWLCARAVLLSKPRNCAFSYTVTAGRFGEGRAPRAPVRLRVAAVTRLSCPAAMVNGPLTQIAYPLGRECWLRPAMVGRRSSRPLSRSPGRLGHIAASPQHRSPLGPGGQGAAARDHRGVLLSAASRISGVR
jgi:hypothetical protein